MFCYMYVNQYIPIVNIYIYIKLRLFIKGNIKLKVQVAL